MKTNHPKGRSAIRSQNHAGVEKKTSPVKKLTAHKKCENCGELFTASKSTARFCSPRCASRY